MQYLRKPIGPVYNETKSRPLKITTNIKKPKLQTILRDHTVQGTITIICCLQELYIGDFTSF